MDDRAEAIAILNGVKLDPSDESKLRKLGHLRELIIMKNPHLLLREFFEHIIELQFEPSQAIRRFVIGFIEDACKTDPSYLMMGMETLTALTEDESIQVVKRAITASAPCFRKALSRLIRRKSNVDDMKLTWELLNQSLETMRKLCMHQNDGVRCTAVKFLETAAIAMSPPDVHSQAIGVVAGLASVTELQAGHPIPGFTLEHLSQRAEQLASVLLEILPNASTSTQASVLVGSLAALSRARPQLFYKTIVPNLTALAGSPPPVGAKAIASFNHALRSALLALIKHPAALPTNVDQLIHALTTLGAREQGIKARCTIDRAYTPPPIQTETAPHPTPTPTPTPPPPPQPTPTQPTQPPSKKEQPTPTHTIPEPTPTPTPTPTQTDTQPTQHTPTPHTQPPQPPPAPRDTALLLLKTILKSLSGLSREEHFPTEEIMGDIPVGAIKKLHTLFQSTFGPLPLSHPSARTHTRTHTQAPSPPSLTGATHPTKMIPPGLTHSHTENQRQDALPQLSDAMVEEDAISEDDEMDIGEPIKALSDGEEGGVEKRIEGAGALTGAMVQQLVCETGARILRRVLPAPQHNVCLSVYARLAALQPFPSPFHAALMTHVFEDFVARRELVMLWLHYEYVLRECADSAEDKTTLLFPSMADGDASLPSPASLPDHIMPHSTPLASPAPMQSKGLFPDTKTPPKGEDATIEKDVTQTTLAEQAMSVYQEFKEGFGSRYERVLIAVLRRLPEVLDAGNKQFFPQVFLEVPSLPRNALMVLDAICRDPLRTETGISTLRYLILFRPAYRESCLGALLSFATESDEALRKASIHVLAHKLFKSSKYAPVLIGHASECLRKLKEPQDDETEMRRKRARVDAEGENTEQDNTDDPESRFEADGFPLFHFYFALCSVQHSLLQGLFDAYPQCPKAVQQAMHRQIPLILASSSFNPTCSTLVQLVREGASGAQPLLMEILKQVAAKGSFPDALADAVFHSYTERKLGISFVLPLVDTLSRDRLHLCLPDLLSLSDLNLVKRILDQLVGDKTPVDPVEIFVMLHVITTEQVPLKRLMQVTQHCLTNRTVFTQERIATVLQRLIELTSLPVLLMRTTIQTLQFYPELTEFVVEHVLTRLVQMQIWHRGPLWEGFKRCCNVARPQSVQVMVRLPIPQLNEVLLRFPSLTQPLADTVSQNPTSFPQTVVRTVGEHYRKFKEQQRFEESQRASTTVATAPNGPPPPQ